MARTSDCDQIVSRGSLDDGSARVDYYTTAPAPTQWTAIGVMFRKDDTERPGMTRRMLVGTGPTETAAIAELTSRFAQVQEEHQQRMHHLMRARTRSATATQDASRSHIDTTFNQPRSEIVYRPTEEAGQSPTSSP